MKYETGTAYGTQRMSHTSSQNRPVTSHYPSAAATPTRTSNDSTALSRLVGISGLKRSGKTTLGNLLCAYHGMQHRSFAEPIRNFIAGILGMPMAVLEAKKEDPVDWLDGITPRSMLQSLGSEWGRDMVSPDLWVVAAMFRIGEGSYVFSDVRFANEARTIRSRGGTIIRVHRRQAESGDAHVSEIPLPADLVDHEIDNNGTDEDLLGAAEKALFGRVIYGNG